MPELPEVETVRRGLAAQIQGATIQRVTLRRKDLRIPFPQDFAESLAGRRVKRINRRSKYILFHLDDKQVLIAHLGMSGCFTLLPTAPAKPGKHDHVLFHLTDGQCLVFSDPRRFGLMALGNERSLPSHPLLVQLGPEPFSEAFNAAYLKEKLQRRKGPIKPALMDAGLVVGVGNIYASEALFRAGIHPAKPAPDAARKAKLLADCIRTVLTDAIESGGSSLRDFVHIGGEAGYFQHRFDVYGRAGKPCNRCSAPISSIKQAGRSSFFCPRCQKP